MLTNDTSRELEQAPHDAATLEQQKTALRHAVQKAEEQLRDIARLCNDRGEHGYIRTDEVRHILERYAD